MTDNFDQIRGLMKIENEDQFYYLVILRRKKENPDVGSNSYAVKHYFLKSLEEFDKRKEEIIQLCTVFNARACIYLNRRSFERCAFHTMAKISNILLGKQYSEVKKAYTSICGMHNGETVKTWILDCDFPYDEQVVKNISWYIQNCEPFGEKVVTTIPTKNGFHIISKPYNVQRFDSMRRERYSDMDVPTFDIQKDNPTILMIP